VPTLSLEYEPCGRAAATSAGAAEADADLAIANFNDPRKTLEIFEDITSAAFLIAFLTVILPYVYIRLMTSQYYTDPLNAAFQALSDPTRRAILARLAQGEATVSQLMEPFELSQPTISKHLKVLEHAGLIEGGRDAQRRPRRLAPLAMKDIADWIEPFRQQWESRLNNLDTHLATMKQQKEK
jgi:DNA-binding transcriptional ArsR family regulator